MFEGFFHSLVRLAGVPNAPSDGYYEVVAAVYSGVETLILSVITGLVVYLVVTRHQKDHLDHMRVSDRLSFIQNLEEEFRQTIHSHGFLVWSDDQDKNLHHEVARGRLQEAERPPPTTETMIMHQLKLFFDLPPVAISRDDIELRVLPHGRYLAVRRLPQACIAGCRNDELKALVTGRRVAVDDQMLSRISILFHRLDRAMQSRLFSGSDSIAFWRLLRYGDRLYFSFLLFRTKQDTQGRNRAETLHNIDSVFGRYGRVFASFLLYFETSRYEPPIREFLASAHHASLELVLRILARRDPLPAAEESYTATRVSRAQSRCARSALRKRIREELRQRTARA